ncbi:MAG: hypothetical protein MZU95_04900 [Desulfomicrobium escambiense]|nr:hypothetical protein [Desulfomicrobium escambiense]
MGTGIGHGENRAVEAAQKAISSPLLEDTSIDGARGVIINITGGHGPVAASRSTRRRQIIHEAGPRGGQHHLRRGHRPERSKARSR